MKNNNVVISTFSKSTFFIITCFYEELNELQRWVVYMYYEGCTFDEIRAYRDLESETFDFGEGEMDIDGYIYKVV